MSRMDARIHGQPRSFPRVSGDEPRSGRESTRYRQFSPRERG